ncbi:hotdog family protein [Staphylococcus durrellii]|uniref:hypothetical protein n=1 Tax=Staphylococcus durrellii TaxID=2781773 RepID=UPI0018A10367|nr:hypothetical protein [Staphylococcus durrellii]MBF7017801.1 hypothetical protein [Staphylococcus durrellii]
MTQITKQFVEKYLALVDDQNPIHDCIVPGQLVLEVIFSKLELDWKYYEVKYMSPISINEEITIENCHDGKINVLDEDDVVKTVILNKDN